MAANATTSNGNRDRSNGIFTAEVAEVAEEHQLQRLFQKHLQLKFLRDLCDLCGKNAVAL